MLYTKLNIWKIIKRMQLKYILVEIALICIGVLLATYMTSRVQKNQNQKFIKNNLILAINDLSENDRINTHYWKHHKKLLEEYREMQKWIKAKDTVWFEKKDLLLQLSTHISLANENVGFLNIVNNDINKIEDKQLKLQIIDYLDFMKQNMLDMNSFNANIDGYSNLSSKHFIDADYGKGTFARMGDFEKFYSDYETQNQLDKVLFERLIYLELIEFGIKPKIHELIKRIRLYVK